MLASVSRSLMQIFGCAEASSASESATRKPSVSRTRKPSSFNFTTRLLPEVNGECANILSCKMYNKYKSCLSLCANVRYITELYFQILMQYFFLRKTDGLTKTRIRRILESYIINQVSLWYDIHCVSPPYGLGVK